MFTTVASRVGRKRASGSGGLTPSGVTPGTYGDSSHVGQFTVDINGIITFAADVPVAGGGTVTQVNTDTDYTTGGPITGTGTVSASIRTKSAVDSALHILCGGI